MTKAQKELSGENQHIHLAGRQHLKNHSRNQPSWQHFHLNMTNFASSKVSNTSTGDETQLTNPVWISFIFNIIVNSITCPFTILLNVLVIMAVKSRPRLQSKANILLACLAVTDAATGLIVQPAFILWMILKLLDIDNQTRTVSKFIISSFLRALFVSSSLHLTLVTFERLVAIKFTMHYTVYVTNKLIKVAVTAFWVIALLSVVLRFATDEGFFSNIVTGFALISCVVFIALSFIMLYRETRRHEKMIKAQQPPQEEVERFAKESKALKTTVYVVGAVVMCFMPVVVNFLVSTILKVSGHWMQFRLSSVHDVFAQTVRTCGVLNSLLNPLIYCWRQREMRRFIFNRFSAAQNVHPAG